MTNLLSIVLWLPLIGAALLLFIPRTSEGAAKAGALIFSTATFLLSLFILGGFEPHTPGMQLVESHPWIPSWGITYAL